MYKEKTVLMKSDNSSSVFLIPSKNRIKVIRQPPGAVRSADSVPDSISKYSPSAHTFCQLPDMAVDRLRSERKIKSAIIIFKRLKRQYSLN